MPSISVIVPVYNGEKYIAECLRQLTTQTLKDIEIVIVNDGSSDHTEEIVRSLMKDSRIKLISRHNTGQGIARNDGIRAATGKYVAFMDCDDRVDPDMYRKLYETASAAGADSCMCGYRTIHDDGKETRYPNPYGGRVFCDDEVVSNVLTGILGPLPEDSREFILGVGVWKALYSRELILEKNLWFRSEKEYYSEDTIFNIEYFLSSKCVAMVEDCLYSYCKFNSTYTRIIPDGLLEKNIRFYHFVNDMIDGVATENRLDLRLQRRFLGFLRFILQSTVYGNTFVESLRGIRRICGNDTVRTIMRNYPYDKGPFKQRVINMSIDHNMALLVWFLFKVHRIR